MLPAAATNQPLIKLLLHKTKLLLYKTILILHKVALSQNVPDYPDYLPEEEDEFDTDGKVSSTIGMRFLYFMWDSHWQIAKID